MPRWSLALALWILAGCSIAEVKPDTEQILGRWDYVSVRHRGQPFEVGAGAYISIDRDRWVINRNDMKLEADYRLEPTKDPKQVDTKVEWPDGRVIELKAIYEIDGDWLKICEPEAPGMPRPTQFSAGTADPAFLVVLKRVR